MTRMILALSAITLICCGAARAADDAWTSWSLSSRNGSSDGVEGWVLMLHPDGRVSSNWVGPMYDSEAGDPYVTLEGLESLGTYVRTGSQISFRNDDFGDGWLWEWGEVTCRIAQSASRLTLSGCIGHHRGTWLEADPLQPPDMEFDLQK